MQSTQWDKRLVHDKEKWKEVVSDWFKITIININLYVILYH